MMLKIRLFKTRHLGLIFAQLCWKLLNLFQNVLGGYGGLKNEMAQIQLLCMSLLTKI